MAEDNNGEGGGATLYQDEEMPTKGELLEHMTDEYSKYLEVDTAKHRQQMDDSIEELLMKLDEYCGLVDIIRSDTSLCLNRTLVEINEKSHEMEAVFDKIDRLEAFVAMVKINVDGVEELVNKAESDMGSFSSVKKVFNSISLPSFLSKKQTTAPKEPQVAKLTKFTAPTVFKTEEYFCEQASSQPTAVPSSLTKDIISVEKEAFPPNREDEFVVIEKTANKDTLKQTTVMPESVEA